MSKKTPFLKRKLNRKSVLIVYGVTLIVFLLLLLPPTGKTTADFQAGKLLESSSPMAAIDLTANKYTELEWVLTANSSAVTSTQYEFRVTKNGTALDTYSQTPKWTIGTTPTTFKGQTIICLRRI